MSAADRCYGYRSTKQCQTGTTKNPSPISEKVSGTQCCAFCEMKVCLQNPVDINPVVGYVCKDCSHPKKYEKVYHTGHYPGFYSGVVRFGPFGIFKRPAYSEDISHYRECAAPRCENQILREEGTNTCSLGCKYSKEREDQREAESLRRDGWNQGRLSYQERHGY